MLWLRAERTDFARVILQRLRRIDEYRSKRTFDEKGLSKMKPLGKVFGYEQDIIIASRFDGTGSRTFSKFDYVDDSKVRFVKNTTFADLEYDDAKLREGNKYASFMTPYVEICRAGLYLTYKEPIPVYTDGEDLLYLPSCFNKRARAEAERKAKYEEWEYEVERTRREREDKERAKRYADIERRRDEYRADRDAYWRSKSWTENGWAAFDAWLKDHHGLL